MFPWPTRKWNTHCHEAYQEFLFPFCIKKKNRILKCMFLWNSHDAHFFIFWRNTKVIYSCKQKALHWVKCMIQGFIVSWLLNSCVQPLYMFNCCYCWNTSIVLVCRHILAFNGCDHILSSEYLISSGLYTFSG